MIPSPRIRRSPFYDATVAAGCSSWTVYNKMLMPLSYGDLPAEYDRLINGVAMWDVAVERQVQLEGPDAHACAQYLSSRDLSKMVVGQGKYVAMCDHHGHIMNDPILLKLADGRYWFSIADSDMLPWCLAVAKEKGFAVDVTEPDVSPLAVQGPKAEDLVAELFGDEVRSLKYFWFTETALDDIPIVVCRSGWSKQGGFELFLQDGSRGIELWDRVASAGEKYGIGPGAPNHVERVESGLLSCGGDTTPDSNPYEALMARFVTPNIEADFIGKEALRAVEAAGPSRKMIGLFVEGDDSEPWPLPQRIPVWQKERQVGTLSAIVWSPRLNRRIGIAQILTEVIDSGQTVEIETPTDGRVSATTTTLPFI